ncbi:MAG: invasion associated locus B family protein [Paracoccaceae bacterium]
MIFSAISPLSKSFALAVLLSCPVSTGWAQEATTPPAQDAAPPADAAAAPAADGSGTAGLSMGTEVTNDGPGTSYVEARFEAWEQRCIRTEDGSDPCQLYQLLKDSDGNAVAEFSLFNLPTGGQAVAGATVVVPLETLLTENLLMTVDTSSPRVYPFTFCSTIGCVARIGFTAAEVEQFKRGAKAVLTIVPVVAPDQKVTVDLSLKGFTAGYTAVSATNP